MQQIFNNKVLKLIPVVFFIALVLKITYTYNDIENKKYEFAKKQAEVLKSYDVSSRIYYQNLFMNDIIKLDEATLQALPAYNSNIISNTFSNKNALGISLKSVSDRPMGDNMADVSELKAIKYFNENLKERDYFSDENETYYQYASALRTTKSCLKCHGKKEDAPLFIKNTYDNAYDYKMGELRGIVSIKIPTKNLNEYFLNNFVKLIIYDFILFLLLFLGINYLVSKSKKINNLLKMKIQEKTIELKNTLLYDNLTHLPNRLKLIEDLAKNNTTAHLSLINIDRFKDINDLYGYKVGDKILKQVAQTMQKLSMSGATVYKLPTDEFGVFATENINEKEFLKTVKNLIKSIEETMFSVDQQSIFITLSSGVASNENSLIIKANVALQLAKIKTQSIVVYDKLLDTKKKILQNNAGILMLKEAIKNDTITPYFQPIYNTHTKKIEKYESLARIILKNGDVISPFKFLDIAIKTKLYPEITHTMIRKSFEYFKDKNYEFSLNISILDVENKKTVNYLLDAIKKFPEPKRIVLEILESDKVDNYEKLKEFINTIKQYGCKFAIDDFGSGYSNFAHIFELNIDYLKIDSSLVKHITTDGNSRIIIKTIISFASSMGLKTIAEYVENKDSLDMLEKMGIDYIQGYYIGMPEKNLI